MYNVYDGAFCVLTNRPIDYIVVICFTAFAMISAINGKLGGFSTEKWVSRIYQRIQWYNQYFLKRTRFIFFVLLLLHYFTTSFLGGSLSLNWWINFARQNKTAPNDIIQTKWLMKKTVSINKSIFRFMPKSP